MSGGAREAEAPEVGVAAPQGHCVLALGVRSGEDQALDPGLGSPPLLCQQLLLLSPSLWARGPLSSPPQLGS